MARMQDDEAALFEASQKMPSVNLVELAVEQNICNRKRAEYLVRKLARTKPQIMVDDFPAVIRRPAEPEYVYEDDIDTELEDEDESIGDIQRHSGRGLGDQPRWSDDQGSA